MKVYLVYGGFDYQDTDTVLEAFSTRELAQAYIDKWPNLTNKRDRAMSGTDYHDLYVVDMELDQSIDY